MSLRGLAAVVACVTCCIAAPVPVAAAWRVGRPPLRAADYLRFADEVVMRLDATWRPGFGYVPGTHDQETVYNAELLRIHAEAALAGHLGPARNDRRARVLAERLTATPPFWTGPPAFAHKMFHAPGWVKNIRSHYSGMDKAVDPKVAAALVAAVRARDVIGLPGETVLRVAEQVSSVAGGPFFRHPALRLNQINWNAELYAAAAEVAGDAHLLRRDYRAQVRRFVRGSRRPWLGGGTATNLSPSYRFHYQVNAPARIGRNLDSPEYASMTLDFLSFHRAARAAGMRPLPAADVRLLRAWLTRVLHGAWTHAGALSWDTGLGWDRWMQTKTWAFALQGVLAIARSPDFRTSRAAGWAKHVFDRALAAYARMGDVEPLEEGLPPAQLHGVHRKRQGPANARLAAARMGAHAVRAMAAGLGARRAPPPPPFYAFDADVGRLAVSTPRYAAAILADNRGALPYGGIDLARLSDGDGDVIGGIGGRPPAAFGVVVRDARGRRLLATQSGRHRGSLVLARSPRGRVTRVRRLPPDPDAGPFRRLRAIGTAARRGVEVRSRYDFRAGGIAATWTLRRAGARDGLAMRVQFPSWGAAGAVEAHAPGSGTVALPPGRRIALRRLRAFTILSDRGAYRVVLDRRPRGVAVVRRPRRQPSAPRAGVTLELRLRVPGKAAGRRLGARIVPRRGRPVRGAPGA